MNPPRSKGQEARLDRWAGEVSQIIDEAFSNLTDDEFDDVYREIEAGGRLRVALDVTGGRAVRVRIRVLSETGTNFWAFVRELPTPPALAGWRARRDGRIVALAD